MEWILSIAEWSKTTIEQAGANPVAIPLAFLLGLASAIGSACCTLPVFGAIVGYAGTRETSDRRSSLLGALFFMIGTIIALIILGIVAGMIGQVAQDTLGKYWKLFAGLAAIVFGLATLKLIPFKLSFKGEGFSSERKHGMLGVAIAGLVMGGAVSACSLGCNPGIFIIIGVAVLQGYTFWMLGVLLAYSIGFSLPLAALILGVSLGRSAVKVKKAELGIRFVAGVLLIGAGFYFLSTF
ncbi:MAG: cytochrome c biogenesis protein CcdA [Victivallales bacterium]|jgi:cytochrome c biogenesis protein CcdA